LRPGKEKGEGRSKGGLIPEGRGGESENNATKRIQEKKLEESGFQKEKKGEVLLLVC